MDVRHASSIEEARRLLSGGKWDLLLLDRRLPDGDGVELCTEVRNENPHGFIMMLNCRKRYSQATSVSKS